AVALGDTTNNIINIDGSGGITITSIITDDPETAGAKQLTLSGAGSGVLTLGGGNTFTGKVTVNSGKILSVFAGNAVTHLGNATGSDALTLNGGTLRTTNTNSVTSPSTRGLTVTG